MTSSSEIPVKCGGKVLGYAIYFQAKNQQNRDVVHTQRKAQATYIIALDLEFLSLFLRQLSTFQKGAGWILLSRIAKQTPSEHSTKFYIMSDSARFHSQIKSKTTCN
jgi:hypothetical protein